jgi:hypothetical protein
VFASPRAGSKKGGSDASYRVFLVDLKSDRVTEVVLQPGDEPGRSVQDGGSRVHVAARRSGALVIIDLDFVS